MAEYRTNLWAPWRIDYIRGIPPQDAPDAPGNAPRNAPHPPPRNAPSGDPSDAAPAACFLCAAAGSDDDLVLLRDERGVLMMNRYPYANGHMMAVPKDHVGDLSDLTADQRAGLMELAELGGRLLRRAMHAQGVNVGMNLGRCAGAGVPGHLHLHVVPRWQGDVSFMEVVGQVRVIPEALESSFAMLKDALAVEA